jgi:hypothetical protein
LPRLLQNEQKQHRLEVSRELQQQLQEHSNLLSKVVTGDVIGFMATTLKLISSHRIGKVNIHLGQKKARQVKSNIKSI